MRDELTDIDMETRVRYQNTIIALQRSPIELMQELHTQIKSRVSGPLSWDKDACLNFLRTLIQMIDANPQSVMSANFVVTMADPNNENPLCHSAWVGDSNVQFMALQTELIASSQRLYDGLKESIQQERANPGITGVH